VEREVLLHHHHRCCCRTWREGGEGEGRSEGRADEHPVKGRRSVGGVDFYGRKDKKRSGEYLHLSVR